MCRVHPKGKGQFWGLSRPLKSTGSLCCDVRSKMDNSIVNNVRTTCYVSTLSDRLLHTVQSRCTCGQWIRPRYRAVDSETWRLSDNTQRSRRLRLPLALYHHHVGTCTDQHWPLNGAKNTATLPPAQSTQNRTNIHHSLIKHLTSDKNTISHVSTCWWHCWSMQRLRAQLTRHDMLRVGL